jgi:hypothetical protein
MKSTLKALALQLGNYSDLSYAHKYAYIARDPVNLIESNNFPFYNLFPGTKKVTTVPDTSKLDFERHILPVTIHFAVQSLEMDIAIMGNDRGTFGILDFADHIWNAIKEDKTLGGIVDDVIPDFNIPMDPFVNGSNEFLVISEFTVEFYRDIALR